MPSVRSALRAVLAATPDPSSDAMIGRVKGWTAATIDAWHARRR